MTNNQDLTITEIECYKLLGTLKYSLIWDFLQENLTKTFSELTKILYYNTKNPDDFNLLFSLRREAVRTNNQRNVTQDALIRYLHEYQANWQRTSKSIKNRMRVYNSLERMFYQFNPSYKERIRNIWDYLEYRVPPQFNWMPESVNDPIIIEAFDKYWPVDEKNQIQKT